MGTADKLREAAEKRRAFNPAQVGDVYSADGDVLAQVQAQAQVQVQDSGRPALNIRVKEPVKVRMHRAHVLVPERIYRLAEKEARKYKISVAELFRQILQQTLDPS